LQQDATARAMFHRLPVAVVRDEAPAYGPIQLRTTSGRQQRNWFEER
jgi:hypothetical protein